MACECETDYDGAAAQGWSNVQIGVFTVVGYVLYRFSQTLPALIRWPVRIFCSLTGLSALWSWVGRLVGAIKGIRNFYKLVSRLWKYIVEISHKHKWIGAVVGALTGSSLGTEDNASTDPDLRLILVGPHGGGRTSLADTLLGYTRIKAPVVPLTESTKVTAQVDGRLVTVIDTPGLLEPSLGSDTRAREALRSLRLVSPGPHAVLVVVRAPGTGAGANQEASRAIRATLELFGSEVSRHVVPVLTHADHLGRTRTVDQMLSVDGGDLRGVVSLCGQKPELVAGGSECPPEAQQETRRRLVGRVAEMKEQRGAFVHELQRREERFREELLTDMASALALKLGHM